MTDEKWADDAWKTPEYACLNCGKVVDAAGNSPLETEPRAPQEGDVTVCLNCSHIMIFKADKTVRNATLAELNEIANDPDILRLLEAMRVLRDSPMWRRKGKHEILSRRTRQRAMVRAAKRPPDGEQLS